ncbi:MAG: polysaccharide deacetylase family protein [Pyrinomonadaceae bacterium]
MGTNGAGSANKLTGMNRRTNKNRPVSTNRLTRKDGRLITNRRGVLLAAIFCAAASLAFVAAVDAQRRDARTKSPHAAQSPPAARAGGEARRVAVTFDDLPMTGDGGRSSGEQVAENLKKIAETLKANDVPAIGFVNENKLEAPGQREARTDALRAWLDAGFDLGNHTYSHRSFYRTPLAAFEQEVIKGEPVTKQLLAERGKSLRYFRHPFLNTGRTLADKRAFEKFLAARGYEVAPVTVDNSEWVFAQAYSDAIRGGDDAKRRRLAAEYAPYMETMFEFYERLSRDLFKREIPQVLLVHANQLNGDHFAEIVSMLKARGYSFITLDEALADPAYRSSDGYVGDVGVSWLQRWRVTRGQAFRPEPPLPEYARRFDADIRGASFKTRAER